MTGSPTAAAAAAQTLDLCALGVRRYTGYDVNEELVLRNAARPVRAERPRPDRPQRPRHGPLLD
jgi:hypothetical protein